MSFPKKLASIGGPVLAFCVIALAPLIGSTTASADGDGGTPPPPSTSTTPPPAGTDSNPWHG
ncbi:hypothetical protein ACIOD2_08375 [Amycolatopsis sp. NPDC088138]|uniref:hypothetical protein n=1 Tax=Amycolatopsis sp. NPDC088138 TaxID=3363938 RepID=UPI0038298A2C